MNRLPELQARIVYLALRMGPVAWAGVGTLLAALALTIVSRLQAEPANRAALEERSSLELRLARASAPGAMRRDAADPVGAIAGQLPGAERMPAFIHDVQDRAVHEGIQIDRAEYRVQSALGKRALRMQLVMPAHGTYPQLRTWLQALLHEYPSAVLDELGMRRHADGAAELEAHVTLSLYCQPVR